MNNSIKIGDTVRVSKDAPTIYNKGWLHDWCNTDSVVKEIDKEDAVIASILRKNDELAIPTKYLVKVGAEKEAKYRKDDKVCINKSSLKHGLRGEILTIIGVDVSDRTYYVQSRCMRSPIWLREDEILPCVEPTEQTEAEKPNHTIKIPVEVDLSDSYWAAYAADLAKEIVLKVANKYNDPKEAAEYAINVAEAVVEGLKRK